MKKPIAKGAAGIFATLCDWREPEGWTEGDMLALRSFHQTEAGRKLAAYLGRETIGAQERACLGHGDAWMAGIATGFKAFWAYQQQLAGLSASPVDSPSTSEEPDGAPDRLERLAP